MQMKKQSCLLVLVLLACLSAFGQDLSTGIDTAGIPLAPNVPDPNWRLVASPAGPADVFRCPTQPASWQSSPVAGTQAGWISGTGNISNNLPGTYVFERDFAVASGYTFMEANFRVAFDSTMDSLFLVRPDGMVIPLTVEQFLPYRLSHIVHQIVYLPMVGTWKIRAKVHMANGVGGFMLSGNIPVCESSMPLNLRAGLIAYYPFSAGTRMDHGPNSLHLNHTNTNGPPIAMDRNGWVNGAIEFYPGANPYHLWVPLPSGILPSANSPWSVALWYKPRVTANSGYGLLFGRGTATNCPDGLGELSLGIHDCQQPVMRFNQLSCADTTISAAQPSCASQVAEYINNGWQHLVAVYDPSAPPGSQYLLYRDGVVSSQVQGPCGPAYVDAGDLVIGLGYFGYLDDLFFYDHAIPVEQVYQLMQLGSAGCNGQIVNADMPVPMAGLQVAPNPSAGMFKLQMETGDGMEVDVYDLQGKSLLHRFTPGHTLEIDLGDAAAGIYLVRVQVEGRIYFHRIVRE